MRSNAIHPSYSAQCQFSSQNKIAGASSCDCDCERVLKLILKTQNENIMANYNF